MAKYTSFPTPPSGWTEEAGGLTDAQFDETWRAIDEPNRVFFLGYLSGAHINNAYNADNLATIATAANRFDLMPFRPRADVSIAQIGVNVGTAVASSLAKVVIYEMTGPLAADLVFEGANLDCASTGNKFETISYAFKANRYYLLGVRGSSTQTLRGIGAGGMIPLQMTTSTSTTHATLFRSTLTYATAAPASIDLSSGWTPTAGTSVAIRMVVA